MAADVIDAEGVVVQQHKSGHFTVAVNIAGATVRVLARCSGKLVKHRIRLLPTPDLIPCRRVGASVATM